MTVQSRPAPAPFAGSTGPAARCAHCAGPMSSSSGRFCCTGCEGAHALIEGLGLDAFYRRQETAEGALRPEQAEHALDYAPLARPLKEGVFELELMVSGLTCGACIWLVEQALASEADVLRARANLSTRKLVIAWQGEAGRANALAGLLARLGFRAAPWSPACLRATEDEEGRELVRALGIAAFGSMNIMLASVAVWVGWDMGEATRAMMHWISALLGLPIVLVAGMPFYRSAWRSTRQGRPNMDLAITLGVLATAAMSLSETIHHGPYTYFDGAVMLLALLLAGRVFDRAARRKARQAVAELLSLQDGTVSLLMPDGTLRAVQAEAVRVGDLLSVAAGERLRLDGVLEGEAEALIDTAATTGESLPRAVAPGGLLAAGSVNMGRPLVMRVSAAAKDGSLAAMARLLERAEAVRGRYVAIADRAARWYVPVVHAVAGATFLGWWLGAGVPWQQALVPAVASLIVTCPCALAIAVPAVQVVATGALFRRGILVASPTALERLASADRAVLDKTGTLTEGRPELLAETMPDRAALRLAASMARASRHPLSLALVRACPEAPLAPGVEEVPGAGLAWGQIRLGSAAFCGIVEQREGEGKEMGLWLARPGLPALAFRFADRTRADAAQAVRGLAALGLPAELLSGDRPAAVAAMAAEAGIETWRAGVRPEEKAARIEALKAEGHRPLMLGDGINDASALALAHVSVSPAGATDLAQTAADLVLRSEELSALPFAIRIARRAQALARQNIGLSLAYNVVAVPLAVLGHVTPLIAAVVMASSSIIVILNALRAGDEGSSA